MHAVAHPHGVKRNRAVTPCYNDCMYMDIVAYYLQSNPFLYTCSLEMPVACQISKDLKISMS